MKFESLGQVFFDGRILSLDDMPVKEIDNYLKQINDKEAQIIDNLNNVLRDLQK